MGVTTCIQNFSRETPLGNVHLEGWWKNSIKIYLRDIDGNVTGLCPKAFFGDAACVMCLIILCEMLYVWKLEGKFLEKMKIKTAWLQNILTLINDDGSFMFDHIINTSTVVWVILKSTKSYPLKPHYIPH